MQSGSGRRAAPDGGEFAGAVAMAECTGGNNALSEFGAADRRLLRERLGRRLGRDLHDAIDREVLRDLRRAIGPANGHRRGSGECTEAEVKNWTIGVAFASAGLDLTHEDAAIGESDASLSADGIAVDLHPIADEPQFEPMRAGRAVVGVHPTRSGEVEVAIMVVVGPRANIGGRELGKPRGLRDIDERNRRINGGVSKEHGKVLLTETRVGVDGGEEEVERAVIVEVAAGWTRVALLVINAAFAEVFEPKCVRGTEVAEEPALRLVAARVDMGEVAREEVDVAVAVEIAEAGADRVAALEARARGNRVALGGLVGELRVAVVDEERVRLQPVVRRVDVEIAVLVEVARGDAARSALPDASLNALPWSFSSSSDGKVVCVSQFSKPPM